MWSEYFALMLMAVLLRTSHELTKPKSNDPDLSKNSTSELTPQQKEWADKSVRGYIASQERKWHHWNDTMFEPKA
jgi:hypothetical protein